MSQHVFIIYNDQNNYIVDEICKTTFINNKFYCENLKLTGKDLLEMAKSASTEYFYVIHTRQEIVFDNFNFSFKPEEWDKNYVHIWNNSLNVRLYNRNLVLSNSDSFSDIELENGNIKLKNIDKEIYSYPRFDVIFIDYNEWNATENFISLKSRFPFAKRVSKVNGIFEAHRSAANISSTSMFYVVDADAEILPDFRFDYHVDDIDAQTTHVWHSKNPVNNLEYGYGGVKLFPTNLLRNYTGSTVDFTTSVTNSFKVIPEVSNITKFNTDPFSTWRSAFRECVKLSTKIIHNQDNAETEYRLNTWCTVGHDAEFGEFAIMGANDGREYGLAHINQPDKLIMINDFSWLENRFLKS